MDQGDLYRQIVSSLADGIVGVGLDGTVVFANESACALLGVDDLVGRPIAQFLDEDGGRQSAEHLARAAQGRFVDAEVDSMFVRADGSHLWVRLRQTGLREGDRTSCVVLRLSDNHETKQLLEEISTSREQLLRAEQIGRSGSWSWDVTAGRTTYSAGLRDLYGDRVADLMARDRSRSLALTHPDDQARLSQAITGLQDGSEPRTDLELRQRGPQGWMWVRLRARGEYAPDGRLTAASGTFQDITRARDTDDLLQDQVTQNSLMHAVAAAANEATTLDEVLVHARSLVVLHDDWERARAFVPSADGSTLVPHLAAESAGRDAAVGGEPDTGTATEVAAAEECYRRDRTVWDPERLTVAFAIRLDGEVLAVLTITSRPPLYRHEMIEQMVEQSALLLARVAERERAARQLADARDHAVKASQHKSDFLATMSHEIRTPLNGIIGLNELLAVTELSDRQQHLVSGIAVSSRSLLDLINDVLDFSKIEAGRLDVETVDLDVRETLADVGSVLAESARARGIELRVSCDPGVPELVAGDPTRLKQVVLNLGSNAVKFTSEGSVAIRATATPDGDGHLLRVEVHDTGIGIGPAQRRHIFSPFTQADTSTTRTFGGTGLGLAICAEIVAALGGEIGVESEPGRGSTFWFTARLGPATGSAQDAVLAEARRVLGRARVLVVDDDAQNRMILCEQLGWWHARSTGAEDAPSALALLQAAADEQDPYDAVLLDLSMPGQDGLALAAAVRAGGHPDDLPLILLTSAGTPDDAAAREAGLTACLPKPVPSPTLRDVLLATLSRGPGHDLRATDDPEGSVPGGAGPARRHGRVLVVEDNAINQLVARGFLEAQGYTVETADDGAEAVGRLRSQTYDAVLMDVQMPRLDGYAATRAVRHEEDERGRPRTPILAMTAAAVSGERERCLAAGMDDFITKPVSPVALAAALARWVPADDPPQDPAHDLAPDPAHDPAPDPEDGPDRGQDDEPHGGPDGTPVGADWWNSTSVQVPEGPGDPHLDRERLGLLLELGADGAAYLDRAIGNFLERTPRFLDALADAVGADDAEALRLRAHELRGSAGNLGLMVVHGLAGDLEVLGEQGAPHAAPPVLAEITAALERSARALEDYQAWYQARPAGPA